MSDIALKNAPEQEPNHLLNFIKGCGCIGVVFMHILFPGTFGLVVYKLAHFAVPVFFMTSGYFAYPHGDRATILRRAKRVAGITLISVLLYVLLCLDAHIKAGNVGAWLSQFASLRLWVEILVFSNFDVISAGHLWFLPSLVYSYLILALIDRIRGYRPVYWLLPLLFLVKIVVSVILATRGLSWHLKYNFLLGGLPWVLLGNFIASRKESVRKLPLALPVAMSVVGALFALAFVVCRFPVDLSEVGIVAYGAGLFLLAVRKPEVSLSGFVEKLGGIYSVYIYVIHLAVNMLLEKGMVQMGPGGTVWFAWVRPIIVAVTSVIAGMVLQKFLGKRT